MERVLRLSERLFAGSVYVNGGAQISVQTPFGGIGISGFANEDGRAGIDEFVQYNAVTIKNT